MNLLFAGLVVAAWQFLAAVNPDLFFSFVFGHPVVESNQHEREAWTFAGDQTLYVNPAMIRAQHPEASWKVVAACNLVHEGAHKRLDTSTELIPLLFQYMCLQDVGASKEEVNRVRAQIFWYLDKEYPKLTP